MKSTARQRIRKLPLLMGLFLLSLSFMALVPMKKAYADNPEPKLPLVWIDAQHTAAVDSSDKPVVFKQLGYTCYGETTGNGKEGNPIKIAEDSEPLPERNNVGVETIPDSQEYNANVDFDISKLTKKKSEVPACQKGGNSTGNRPAHFQWVTNYKNGEGNYALLVYYSYYPPNRDMPDVDARTQAVRRWLQPDAKVSAVFVGRIGADGKVDINKAQRIIDMKIDPSKAGLVTGNDDDSTEEDLCPIKKWAATWLVCPIIEGIQTGITAMRVWIMQELLFGVQDLFGDGVPTDKNNYYRVWNSFRVLAVALIIIFGIIMVASEALGFGFFNAYTIRKILPRLLVMAIIIALSWWILKYILTFFNNLSVWTYSAIMFPFDLQKDPLDSTVIAAYFVAILAAAALVSPLVVITYALTLLGAFLVATLIFAVRKIALTLLVLTSPVWLACYVTEGTKKVASIATGAVVTLGVMGIAFAGVQAGADVIGLTANDDTDQFGIIRISASAAGILITFLIFTKLGGAAAAITGTFNDKSRGYFDRLKNARRKDIAGNVDAMKRGERWSGRNVLTRGLNRATGSAATAAQTGMPYNPADWKRRYSQGRSQNRQAAAAQAMQAPGWNLINQDDEALRAGTFKSHAQAMEGLTSRYMSQGQSESEATQNAADAVSRYEAAGYKIGTDGNMYAAAQQLVSTGTGYTDFGDMVSTASRVLGKDKSSAGAFGGWANFETKGKGRHDMAPGAGDVISAITQQMDHDNGVTDANGNRVAALSRSQINQATIKGARGANAASLLGSNKTQSISNITRAYGEELNGAVQQVSTTATNSQAHQAAKDEAARMAAEIENMRDSGIYGSGANVAALYGNPNRPGSAPNDATLQAAQTIATPRQTTTTQTVIRTENRGGETVQVMAPEQVATPNAVANQRVNDTNQKAQDTYGKFRNSRGFNPADDPRRK